MEKNSIFSINPIEQIKISNNLDTINTSIELRESDSIILSNTDDDTNQIKKNTNKSEGNLFIKENTNLKSENIDIDKDIKRLKHYGNNYPLLFNKYGEPIIVIGPHCNK